MLFKDDDVMFSRLGKDLLEFFCICQDFAQLRFKSLFIPHSAETAAEQIATPPN
jgi:hypothetical protein